eukprot:TRINITY_DN12608_c0_g1_i1.p1 TRINITY_DN12608_c0_g1~~TRINITY_DN12608_c0_g1_i1.p1  ORF type:complete len:235 (-),score=57.59 TRINITY_DN12608_c0_g1_i1:156-860(-)
MAAPQQNQGHPQLEKTSSVKLIDIVPIFQKAIAEHSPIPKEITGTREFHLSVVNAFGALELKDEVKAQLGLADKEVFPQNLPHKIPEIRGPRFYWKISDKEYGAITTGTPYLNFFDLDTLPEPKAALEIPPPTITANADGSELTPMQKAAQGALTASGNPVSPPGAVVSPTQGLGQQVGFQGVQVPVQVPVQGAVPVQPVPQVATSASVSVPIQRGQPAQVQTPPPYQEPKQTP